MKANHMVEAFLQKAKTAKPIAPVAPINAFHSLFSVQELNASENQTIDTILQSSVTPESQDVASDAHEVKRLTQELRAIRRQELVLIGERVSAAREIFKKYKDRSFRDWMQLTFGSFKTGYNYLAFYDLYLAVPEDVKIHLKDMPAKAVYVLASHKANVEQKVALIKNYSHETAQTVIAAIRDELGGKPARKISNDQIITALEKNSILLSPDSLQASHRARLIALIDHLTDLVELSK